MFFVNQKKHDTSTGWNTGIVVRETENEALHQFHAFMSTYAYGQSQTLDYVACEVQTMDGRIIKGEIDNRMAPEPEVD